MTQCLELVVHHSHAANFFQQISTLFSTYTCTLQDFIYQKNYNPNSRCIVKKLIAHKKVRVNSTSNIGNTRKCSQRGLIQLELEKISHTTMDTKIYRLGFEISVSRTKYAKLTTPTAVDIKIGTTKIQIQITKLTTLV